MIVEGLELDVKCSYRYGVKYKLMLQREEIIIP